MKSITNWFLAVVACGLFCVTLGSACAQTLPTDIAVNVAGDVQLTQPINQIALMQMPQQQVVIEDRTYTGVRLWDVMASARLAPKPGLRNPTLSMYVIAKSSDGYQALFSVGELDPAIGGRRVLIAHSMDGQALPPSSGPFRIVVPDDAKPSRAVFRLTELEIKAAP